MNERGRRANRTGHVPIAVRPRSFIWISSRAGTRRGGFPRRSGTAWFRASRQPRSATVRHVSGLTPRIRPAWGHFARLPVTDRGGGVVHDPVRRENATVGLLGALGGGRQAPLTKVPQTRSPVLGYSCMRHRSAATAPVERHEKRTLPVRRPDHHTAPAPLSACRADKTRVAAQAQKPPAARQKARRNTRMMSRNATASYAGRASSMRRLRRRSSTAHASGRPFCRTNGCPSFLEIDPETGIATCPVCGATQRQRARARAH